MSSVGSGGTVSNTTSDEMRLEEFLGQLALKNAGTEKVVVLGSRLVTGDNIETMTESNAFLVLDQSKMLRVNETSQIEITQDEKKYDVHLEKGTVFFNVTATLTAQESLNFHTANVVTGVRGTSGVIHYDLEHQRTQIVVFTGSVMGTTDSEEQTIEAGQMAIIETLEDGSTEMTIYELEDRPEVNQDMPWITLYTPLLERATAELPTLNQGRTENWEIYQTNYTLRDINGDGTPELILNYQEGYTYTTSIHTVANGALVSFEKTLWSGTASAGGSRGSLSIPENGIGLYLASFSSMNPDLYTTLFTIENGQLVSTSLEMDDWTAESPLHPSTAFEHAVYDTSDFSGLHWTGNS